MDDVDLPAVFDGAEAAFSVITAVEGGRALAWEIANRRDRLNHWIQDQVALGERCSEADYEAACETAAKCREALAGVFGRFDTILTASAPGEPTDDLTGIQKSSFNRVWTMMHGPCITLPAFSGPNGLSVGVQLVGPAGGDDRLIRLANWAWKAIGARPSIARLATGSGRRSASASDTPPSGARRRTGGPAAPSCRRYGARNGPAGRSASGTSSS